MAKRKEEEEEESSSEEVESSSEEEEDSASEVNDGEAAAPAQVDPAAAAAGAAPPQTFDPMNQFLGIPAYQSQAVQGQGVQPQQRAQAFNNTAQQRVAAVKAGMQQGGGQQWNQGGMDAVYQAQVKARQQQQQQAQLMQQMYATQQAQQQMAAYQTYNAAAAAAAYQTGQVNNMQLAVVDPNAAYRGGMGGGMMGGGMMGGGMGGGALVPYQNQAAALIPAMEAEKVKQEASNYRVQRGTKPSRINASDQAFGPLLDQMMKK
uniref:Uncharacterized protein n=1 Tax=Rhodosorus marinus TaxID=101924 RepID=A0A7S3AA63_9RHOD|mmetsp:Transcript_8830/g.39182  ORF Transcript_8830/g.39182 Transcript_8830/m.39182 type:complete len:262 (+) Transcript_8830:144-929(+)|eukprot:CAMPEP_0113969378 /NCGR_PEP_ID=MMETSP0011_2-20120614/10275_1 /TAXON_ID=101924 /ORGANISM="Rhodosorus marinus" /LENGTH=261 /DNA_ID=CAMNT_0000983011 /DNA_START=112 /DNA_END=897 /DNA_ORIENTATION=- /assembly_acc=CAM_ASM_000156